AATARLRGDGRLRRHGLLLRADAAVAALQRRTRLEQVRSRRAGRQLRGGNALRGAARRPAGGARRSATDRAHRPGADGGGQPRVRLRALDPRARRRAVPAGGGRRRLLGRGAGVADRRRAGRPPRGAARHGAGGRHRRRAARSRSRRRRRPARSQAGVRQRRPDRRGDDDLGDAHDARGARAAASRRPGDRHAGPGHVRRHVARGASRPDLRHHRRARPVAHGRAERRQCADRRGLPRRRRPGGDRLAAVGACGRPPRAPRAGPGRRLPRSRAGRAPERDAHRLGTGRAGPARLARGRHPVGSRAGAAVRRRREPWDRPGARLLAGQPGVGGRPDARLRRQRPPGPDGGRRRAVPPARHALLRFGAGDRAAAAPHARHRAGL
ncbi:MAG: hypothetical protein AVDCRST_MAG69-123, partial [uncultured Solirubrobacteraceae bacterium]